MPSNIIQFSEALGVIEALGLEYEALEQGGILVFKGDRSVTIPPHCPTRKTGYSRRKIGNARVHILGRMRTFYVNFSPKHPHPYYQASTDRGVTVKVREVSAKAAIAEAKRRGVHKQGDYPGMRSFNWWAEEA